MRFAKVRWLLAAACLLFSGKLMTAGLKLEGFGAAPHVIFSMVLFLSSVFLVAPETAFRLAEWCSRPFVAIFFPSDEFSKPPLSYKLARRYRDERRLEDAVRQYKKIIRHYPEQTDAYVELLQVAKELRDDRLYRKYAGLFRKRIKSSVPP